MSTLLIVGGDRRVLAEHLWHLGSRRQEVLVVLLSDDPGYRPDLGDEVLRTLLHFQQLHSGGEEGPLPRILELASFEASTHASRWQGIRQVLVTPEQGQINPEDPSLFDLSLSEPQSDFLTYLEGLGLEMDREVLLESIRTQTHDLLPLAEAFALVETCAEAWLALDARACERAWAGPLGAQFRCLDAMGLWKHRLMSQHRPLVEKAIRHLHEDPKHGGARLVLLLHKRVYRDAEATALPAWCSAVQKGHLETHGRHLLVLPPVRDFRVTILLVTYNRLPLLQRAVNQFLAQTSKDWRLRICDHGSTDGTTEFCQALAKAHPEHVEVIRKATNGGTEALGGIYQEMMASTETELVLGISDDDWLFPTHLEKTLGFFREHPWVGMVTAAYAGVTPEMALEFQYGPFYDTTRMADPQVELQRALHAGVCPQGCIYRRDLLREFATEDPLLAPGKDEFACWDYLVTTKMLAYFEVGYVNEVLTGITISPQTAFAGRDFAYEFLLLMEGLCGEYTGLFGTASYPHGLVHQFTQNVVLPMITRHFVHVLTSATTPQALEEGLEAKRRSWEQFVQAKQRIYVHTSQTAPQLVG